MWFEKLTGFPEESPEQVRKHLYIKDNQLISSVNGHKWLYGSLETPNLSELRERVKKLKLPKGHLRLQECIANVQELHKEDKNIGAFFQVASQFNLLEMLSPKITPDSGVSGYEYDSTQGPACAIAAGAGTIYRNHFVKLNGETGQSKNNQIDTLSDIGVLLGNQSEQLWSMQNGYALASKEGLETISEKLRQLSELEIDKIREQLRIGIQWNTEVTLNNLKHTVSQSYCSALPVAYSQHPSQLWEKFALLILEASYEATICAAILNYSETDNNNVYLTLLGGGAFGNNKNWIISAIKRAVTKYKDVDINVFIVSYYSSNKPVRNLIDRFNSQKLQ